MLLDHLRLLISKIDFVVEEVLSIGQVLDGPVMILSLLILVNLLVILDLLGASGIDLIYGVRLQTLEVIRHITVLRELRGRRHWILGHEVAHISSCNFLLVHILLIVGPGLLSIFLLLSKHLIICLHILQLLVFLISVLVLEKTTHSRNSIGLLGVGGFLILE